MMYEVKSEEQEEEEEKKVNFFHIKVRKATKSK